MNGNHHAWHRDLLKAQFAQTKIVNYVLRSQKEFDRAVYRHREGRNNDIVPASGIVRIEAQRISGRRVHKAGIETPEFPVSAGIAESVNKLGSGDFYLQRIAACRRETRLGPRLASCNAQADKRNDRCGSP